MQVDDPFLDELLARLRAPGQPAQSAGLPASDDNPWRGPSGRHGPSTVESRSGVEAETPAYVEPPAPDVARVAFLPLAPQSLPETRLSETEIRALLLKVLLGRNNAAGRALAEHIRLPFRLVEGVLAQLKADQLVVHKGAAALADYVYQLTTAGQQEASQFAQVTTYAGAAPVHLDDYIASVSTQSIHHQKPSLADINAAFADLLITPETANQIGQALHAGNGFFLYGAPGNGKTSLAERVGRAFSQSIWIPRAISVDGEIIRLFDPRCHTELPVRDEEEIDAQIVDQRWIRIRRPTLIAGGELTMDRLEITTNKTTGINEAPLQWKSNCGTLVIDDFGRQRMSVAELLNRWIVPLDRQYDLLNLPSGKSIQVPFELILVFSTNLEPKDLVDEAFLRRIPYKIEVFDPTQDGFRELMQRYAEQLGIPYRAEVIEEMIARHYTGRGRPIRACHARDLLLHVRTFCEFNRRPVAMSAEVFEVAVQNYFAVVG